MIHLGDITKISGYKAPTVDTIIFGAPCQDLSVAGKRSGMKHTDMGDEETTRSGLFHEAVRIIKEMREYDKRNGRTGESIRPRYGVYENVPGAFSSNKGCDFQIVLQELIKVAEPQAPSISVPEKGWPTAGCILGDKWSVAWRVLDAQFWGVPQRRRRIALVADFGGHSAQEILFVRKSVSGNIEPGKPKGKETPGDAGESSGGAVPYTVKIRGGIEGGGKGALVQTDKSATLSTLQDQTLFQPVTVENPLCIEMTSTKNTIITDGICPTLTARMGTGGNQVNAVLSAVGFDAYNQVVTGGITKPLTSAATDSDHIPLALCGTFQETGIGWWNESNVGATLRAMSGGDAMKANLVVRKSVSGNIEPGEQADDRDGIAYDAVGGAREPAYSIGNGQVNQSITEEVAGALNCMHDQQAILQPVEEPIVIDTDCTVSTLMAKGPSAVQVRYIVRRLTPLECERLQGYPDGWTDIGEWVDSKGKKHKEADSPRYKALGNSIAIPPWKWVLKRLCACYERDATMASLFDGIGGFPYIWEQLNGKGSCLWASEIEEFPIAVTKLRFGGSE